jgi:hypothetical protein
VLNLCAILEKDGYQIRYFVAMACRWLLCDEVTYWSREFPLTRRQEQELLAALRSHHFDMPAEWRSSNRGEGLLALRLLDATYTKKADGNGWFVPYPRLSSDLAARALSMLNVLSPFVNDRLTVTRKIQSAVDRANRAADLPFQQGMSLLVWLPSGPQGMSTDMGNPADGMSGFMLADLGHRGVYRTFTQCADLEAAAITSLGLSAYKTEHEHYPSKLPDLVPEYLPALPIDAVTGKPLRYRLDQRDGYSLYSPGEDGVDNGGLIRNAQGAVVPMFSGNDWVFSGLDRDDPEVEWYLVPDEAGQQSATSQPQ